MNLLRWALFVAALAGCSQPPIIMDETGAMDAFSSLAEKQACFLLYDARTKKIVRSFGGDELCARRLTACSTFKVPAALMGFDSGILKNENTSFKWDGTKWPIADWNHDQTAASWMKVSAVWVTQKIIPEVGMKRVKSYLEDFKYGSEDLSDGLRTSWLTVAPFMGTDAPKGSLKISAQEQLEFMKRWWAEEFKLSKKAYELTKKITLLEKSSGGVTLHGKTGSGFTTPDGTGRIGWFIGHIDGPKGEYITVLNFTDTVAPGAKGYAGLEARETTKAILAQEGLW